MSPELEQAKASLAAAMALLVAAEQDGYGCRDLSITKTNLEDTQLRLDHMMRAISEKG